MVKYPLGKEFPHDFNLDFECKNNVVEYETLILGLETTKNMGIKQLKSFGDSNLIVGTSKRKVSRKR